MQLFLFKTILFFIICPLNLLASDIAPFFPSVSHALVLNPRIPDALSFMSGLMSANPTHPILISSLYQEHPWEYRHIIVGTLFLTSTGLIGIGYSTYGGVSVLPITTRQNELDLIEISEYGSDLFQTATLAYRPHLFKHINLTMMAHLMKRQLMDTTAHASQLDIAITSPHILSHQLGLRAVRIAGTPYTWSNGHRDHLPRYIGGYYAPSITPYLDVMASYDWCMNYPDLSRIRGTMWLQFINSIQLWASYSYKRVQTMIRYGTRIMLSSQLHVMYSIENRSLKNNPNGFTESFHSAGISIRLNTINE